MQVKEKQKHRKKPNRRVSHSLKYDVWSACGRGFDLVNADNPDTAIATTVNRKRINVSYTS